MRQKLLQNCSIGELGFLSANFVDSFSKNLKSKNKCCIVKIKSFNTQQKIPKNFEAQCSGSYEYKCCIVKRKSFNTQQKIP